MPESKNVSVSLLNMF